MGDRQAPGGDVHSVPVDILAALAYLHWYRFQALPAGHDQKDLRRALFFFSALSDQAPERVPLQIRSALSATQTEPADMEDRLTAHSGRVFGEYQPSGRPEAVDAAIASSRDEAATAPSDPHRSEQIAMICSRLVAGFKRTGDIADLDVAIDAIQKALDLGVMGNSDRAGVLSDLAASLSIRHEQTGNRVDLDTAINAAQEAVDLTPRGMSDRPGYLSNLGSFRLTRFEASGDRADLDAAINAGQEAVDLTTKADGRRAGRLSNLGNALGVRSEVTGNDGDLDAAITAQQEAVDVALANHHDLLRWLSNLGSSLLTRFHRLGKAADLDDGIDRLQQAQAIAVTSTGPDRAACLVNLATALLTRFLRAGDDTDLDTAVNAGHQAMSTMPTSSPDRARIPEILASCLLTRFERRGVAKDLDDAIDSNRQAVAATEPSSPAFPERLSNLGNSLRVRFEANGQAADLYAAISAGQQAVDATPPGHPNRAGYLSNLGAALGDRFRLTGECAHLDAAIHVGQQAVDATPPGHPNLALYLSGLGTSLLLGFERACPNGDLDKALQCWQQASQISTGTPSIRLDAAQRWGAVAADYGRMSTACQGYEVAVGLLPEVAWHGLDRTTREEQLSRWAGLAADAAACMIQDGRPTLAVELLEQGRSVLWTQALNLRSDLTQLAEIAPELASRLDSIRAILDSPIAQATALVPERAGDLVSADDLISPEQDAIDQRRRLSWQWDEVVAQVRDLDGFEHFLAAIPYPELASAVAGGPVVIVNASRHGCHALIVAARSEAPRVVGLPGLSMRAAADQANKMLAALAGTGDRNRSFRDREKDRYAILDVLDWLWETIAEPVLAALGHTTSARADEPWPRIWWCPTGPLTVLPIHAAGRHPRLRTADRGEDCVLDRVISSYTLSLTALARAHEAVPPIPVRHLTGLQASGMSPRRGLACCLLIWRAGNSSPRGCSTAGGSWPGRCGRATSRCHQEPRCKGFSPSTRSASPACTRRLSIFAVSSEHSDPSESCRSTLMLATAFASSSQESSVTLTATGGRSGPNDRATGPRAVQLG